jgi:hypothetical protein
MTRLAILAALFALFLPFRAALAETEPVSLDVAVRTGLVDVEVIVGRGSCTGDAVRIDVRRKVNREVRVVVDSGTVVQSSKGDVQSMVCHGVKYEQVGSQYRRVDEMLLKDNNRHAFLLESYCRDFKKPTPKSDSLFRVDVMDAGASRVIVKGKAAGASLTAIQAAVWIQSGVSDEELRSGFNIDAAEVKVAHVIVDAAKAAPPADSETQRDADARVSVLVENLFQEMRQRLSQQPYVRGDTIEVVVGEAPIEGLLRTISTAKQGDKYQVLAVDRKGVRVAVNSDDRRQPQSGWISLANIKLAQGAPRGGGLPVIRKLGELVNEVELEIITGAERGF